MALLSNNSNGYDLVKMVKLILECAENEKDILTTMATLHNYTPLAIAVGHPKVTCELIKLLLPNELTDEQVLIAFEAMARSKTKKEEVDGFFAPILERVEEKLREKDTLKLYNDIRHIIYKHDNIFLLDWFMKTFNAVRLL
jgi:hypothetical protein